MRRDGTMLSCSRLKQVLEGHHGNYIYPFFWMHGEDQECLWKELEAVRLSNINAICVEARPYPDFGGEKWFGDMDFILDYARTHDMKVWILDDDHFPTGHCNGIFSEGTHELSNEFLTRRDTDVVGPLRAGRLLIRSFLNEREGDKLVGVLLCPRLNEGTSDVVFEGSVDVTGYVRNGWLTYDIPEGLWRVIVFYSTHHGPGRTDYFNIINSKSVALLIEEVYEPHFKRYGKDFGKTVEAFFSDEPEFGNLAGYDMQAKLGDQMRFIPWSFELFERLKLRWKGEVIRSLAGLWFEVGSLTSGIRYEYMDEVTKQLKVAFSDQISDWCEEHGVMHVGHIIEDDNAHGRLGCSTGHYFRSLSGMGMAGIDVVLLQILPEMHQTIHQWVASQRDGEFFHFGLGKLGSSLAHVDERKKGRAMCEIFGAYGWQEGVSLMKWLADHMLSRGINYFVPHAFSPKEYPDEDCPPHFYARGNHGQLPYFAELMKYMNRLSHLLSEGRYKAQVAVLYHADAEWAGEAMLFQKPLRVLMENQIEADVISVDSLHEAVLEDGIIIGSQRYEVMIVPYCEVMPACVLDAIIRVIDGGIPVLFVDNYPSRYLEVPLEKEAFVSRKLQKAFTVALDDLKNDIYDFIKPSVQIIDSFKDLRTYVYENEHEVFICCFNESMFYDLSTCLRICKKDIGIKSGKIQAVRYDGIHNRKYEVKMEEDDEYWYVSLELEKGEAGVIALTSEVEELKPYRSYAHMGELLECEKQWKLFYADVRDPLSFDQLKNEDVFSDLTDWAIDVKFNGIVHYRSSFVLEEDGEITIRLIDKIDVCEIIIDGEGMGKLIGEPYCVRRNLVAGVHEISIELVSTPVFELEDGLSSLTMLPPFGLLSKPLIIRN